MLSVRLASAQEIVTPGTASGFGRTTGVGVYIFFGIYGVILVIALILMTIGLIRARRNPERYGPRQARPGRPKQSRAKGLARAVIESIPIIRFGENNANAAAQRDIEPAVTSSTNRSQSATINENNDSIEPDTIAVTSGTSTNMPATAEGDLSTTEPTIQTRPGSLECSICLDNFLQSEEIRVLPCSHRFHLTCIDPWLLNVSGTCPICRYDLRPATITNDSNTVATSTDEPLPPPPLHEVSDNAPGRSRFRELRRAHAGHEEYITALRQLYHELENHLASHASTRTEAARHQESRPTSRLRDTFHIHTGPPESQQTLPDDAIRALD